MNTLSVPTPLSKAIPPRQVTAGLLAALHARFGPQLSTALAVREQHGRDESAFHFPPPEAVVFAQSSQDVADAIHLAGLHNAPIIPFGAGSSLEGHLLAVQGGISLDLGRMNRVLALHAADLTVTLQAGVTRKQLNEEIKHSGLFFLSIRGPTRPWEG
jgi:D-lactate dehydrogenase (cytochrome)